MNSAEDLTIQLVNMDEYEESNSSPPLIEFNFLLTLFCTFSHPVDENQ